jgi:hypothetical protein
VVISQVIIQRPEQVVVWEGQIRTIGWMGKQSLAVWCSSVPVSKRGTQREQTFRYPKISIISWTAWCPTPSCAAISLNVILRSCLMSSSTFCLLLLVAAVLCWPQRGWSAMSVFPSLKCFTHLLTLLAPCRHLHKHHEIAHRWLLPSFPLSQEIQWQYVDEMTRRWQPFSSSAWREWKRCARADFAFILEREDAANGPIKLVTIFLSNSS